MFERVITAIIMVVAVAIVASGSRSLRYQARAPGHWASLITRPYFNAAVLVFLVAYYDLLDGCHFVGGPPSTSRRLFFARVSNLRTRDRLRFTNTGRFKFPDSRAPEDVADVIGWCLSLVYA